MNSFQSLLNSYSELRKRTYEFRTISEGDSGSGAAIKKNCDYGTIVRNFRKIGGPGDKQTMLSAFQSAGPMAEGEKVPDAGVFVGINPQTVILILGHR